MNEEKLFSANGRIRRTTFWTRWLIVFIINIVFSVIMQQDNDPALVGVFSILSLLLSIFIIIQGVKRMHDINKSGWYFIIPVYNIILAFTDGTHGPNKYGPDPKNRIGGEGLDESVVEGYNNASDPQEERKMDNYVLIFLIYIFSTSLSSMIMIKVVDDWYVGFTKYIQFGMNVVWAILLIFVYLLYEVFPLFLSFAIEFHSQASPRTER